MPEEQSPSPTQREIDAAIARGRPGSYGVRVVPDAADIVAIVHAILCAPIKARGLQGEDWLAATQRAAIAAIEAARPDLREKGGE